MVSITDLVDIEQGMQSRRIFWDKEIYEQELERIFKRSWLFLTHESLIRNPADFVLARMAEDEVIVSRQRDGSITAHLNQCMHRGHRLCMAEAGNRKAFVCGYHGWTYDMNGELRGVPFAQAYGDGLDKGRWKLRPVPKVAVYNGFVFGCMDETAPPLAEFLGDFTWYLDIWSGIEGGLEFIGPPSRSVIRSNWKTTTENFVGDTYHVGITHSSALKAMQASNVSPEAFSDPTLGFQATTRYGHGVGVFKNGGMIAAYGDDELAGWLMSRAGEVAAVHGPDYAGLYNGFWNGAMFPNCSFLKGLNLFKVWNPIGPDKVEILTWAFAEVNMPQHLKERFCAMVQRTFGTAGILESDDLDNMEYATQPNRGLVTREGWLNCRLAIGQSRIDPALPGITAPYISESAYRSFYRTYAQCMEAKDWPEFQQRTADWKDRLASL